MGNVADPLREYTTWLYDRRVIDKEESTELYEIADQIDRELERRMREQYARGYTDGQHSMDAKHYAVAIRLMHLPLDEDSHGNLSQIAGAIWHNDFGWTQEACRGLRDKLVRLMGGVHDEHLANICRISGELDENGEFCEIEPRNTVEFSKYAENYKSGHITDELREWASENTIKDMVLTTYPEQHGVHGILEQLIAIADRIDEQEHKLRKQRDGFRRGMVAAQDLLEKRTDERDELQKMLDEYDKTHMKLPVDANGESIHVGNVMEYAEGGKPKEVIAASDTEVFLVDDGPRYSSLCVHHAPVDTAEDIVRDIHLGKVTDSEAIKRIRALDG